MGGRSNRVPDSVVRTWWNVHVDGWGRHGLVDADGHDPLRHPDGLERLRNTYLAASAPALRHALSEITRRFAASGATYGHRDDRLVAWCWDVMHASRPLASEEARMQQLEGQVEMYFEDAA